MYTYLVNDAERTVGRGTKIPGSILRAGRWGMGQGKWGVGAHVSWSHFHRLDWAEVELSFNKDDSHVSIALILPWVIHWSIRVSLSYRWLSKWMLDDRVFSLKVGYVGTILQWAVAYNEHAEMTGRLEYYKTQGTCSKLQRWRGWTGKIPAPPLRTWLFGGLECRCETLDSREVHIPMDNQLFPAKWSLQHRWWKRPRLPWVSKHELASDLRVNDPPQFAGKGENSWDCGNEGISGMGSKELTPAGAVGDYVKAVLKRREKYGDPHEEIPAPPEETIAKPAEIGPNHAQQTPPMIKEDDS